MKWKTSFSFKPWTKWNIGVHFSLLIWCKQWMKAWCSPTRKTWIYALDLSPCPNHWTTNFQLVTVGGTIVALAWALRVRDEYSNSFQVSHFQSWEPLQTLACEVVVPAPQQKHISNAIEMQTMNKKKGKVISFLKIWLSFSATQPMTWKICFVLNIGINLRSFRNFMVSIKLHSMDIWNFMATVKWERGPCFSKAQASAES